MRRTTPLAWGLILSAVFGIAAAHADDPAAPGLEGEGEDASISSKPNAMVLFNPVLRFSGIPQLMERIGNDETLGKAISPTLHLAKDSPPTLIFFGTADRLAAMGDEFMQESKALGHRAELFTAEGQPHGFFNRPPWLERTTQRMDEFLVSIGYLETKRAAPGNRARSFRTQRSGTHHFSLSERIIRAGVDTSGPGVYKRDRTRCDSSRQTRPYGERSTREWWSSVAGPVVGRGGGGAVPDRPLHV
ncbi:MAG: hypothetical protein HUU20_10760 [Pirellulales bacterium]|nr:hypothetical protein [Pirellulales bacterium]